MQVGINPDWIDEETVEGGTLAGLERLPDFAVVYDPAEIARRMLELNYLPPEVFGGDDVPPNYRIRGQVFDFLDIPDRLGTAPAAESRIREALAETAGVDAPGEEPVDESRVGELKAEHTRNALLAAATDLDLKVGTSTPKHELAQCLAELPDREVHQALAGDD